MPGAEAAGPWGDVPEAREAYAGENRRFAAEHPAARESGGVEVRLSPRARAREAGRVRRRRNGGLLAALGVVVLAGLVTAGVVLTSGPAGGGGAVADEPGTHSDSAELPPAGTPVEVGTADGFRYRLAAVATGFSRRAQSASGVQRSSGRGYPYVDYLLTNPTGEKALLEYPGDIFVRRGLVDPSARARCEPQGGIPAALCTPPTTSAVVRRLAGGELVPGDGGDKYLPPRSTYLVRVTVRVPVDRRVTRRDIALYVWEQIFVGTEPAKRVPFPN